MISANSLSAYYDHVVSFESKLLPPLMYFILGTVSPSYACYSSKMYNPVFALIYSV